MSLKCPRDNKQLEVISKDEIHVYSCPECSGFYISKNMLRLVSEKANNMNLYEWIYKDNPDKNDPLDILNCPNDQGEIMYKIFLGSVVIDRCDKCSGVWFDKDELKKLFTEDMDRDVKNLLSEYLNPVDIILTIIFEGIFDL